MSVLVQECVTGRIIVLSVCNKGARCITVLTLYRPIERSQIELNMHIYVICGYTWFGFINLNDCGTMGTHSCASFPALRTNIHLHLAPGLPHSLSPSWVLLQIEGKAPFQRMNLIKHSRRISCRQKGVNPVHECCKAGLSFPLKLELCNKNASISQITHPWCCTWYKSEGRKIPPLALISIVCAQTQHSLKIKPFCNICGYIVAVRKHKITT